MNKLYLCVIIVFLCSALSAQNIWLGSENQKYYEEFLVRKAMEHETESYEGSPYLYDEFTEAQVVLSEKHIFNEVTLRYDVYHDLFEIKMKDAVYNLRRGAMISDIIMGDHKFRYMEYEYMSTSLQGYLDVIEEGEFSLYKQYRIVFREAEPARPYVESKPAMFQKRDPLFYIASGDNRPVFVNNRRNLLNVAGEYEEELKEFIRGNELKLRDGDGMLKAVKFLNGLVNQ